jgi:hypothetical protein
MSFSELEYVGDTLFGFGVGHRPSSENTLAVDLLRKGGGHDGSNRVSNNQACATAKNPTLFVNSILHLRR